MAMVHDDEANTKEALESVAATFNSHKESKWGSYRRSQVEVKCISRVQSTWEPIEYLRQ